MPIIQGMNHFTILAEDLDATRRFYTDLLGLVEGPRPPFTFPGLWLYSGDQAILHVIGGRAMPQTRAGVIDHMAFTAEGLPDTTRRLKALGIPYELRHLPGSGQWQLFCHDPNGAKVELDFAPSEPDPGQ